MKPYQCEAGATYVKGRMKRECFEPATHQIVYDGELLLQVVCKAHAEDNWVLTYDNITIEPWDEEGTIP